MRAPSRRPPSVRGSSSPTGRRCQSAGRCADDPLEAQRALDVVEGVAAQGDERVGRPDAAPPQHGLEDPGDGSVDLGGRRARRRPDRAGGGEHGGGVDLAPFGARQRPVDDGDAAGRQPGQGARRLGHRRGRGGRCAHRDELVVAGHGHLAERRRQLPLDHVEVDPQPERLDEARPTPDDLEHPGGGVEPAEVAGRQLVERGAGGEVGVLDGVAEHDVVAAVDQLADAVGLAVDRAQLQVTAGDRHADGARVGGREVRREVRHPGRGLGLAVHDEELDAAPRLAAGVPAGDGVGGQPTAGDGQEPQRRHVDALRSRPLEELEGVGHAGDVRHAVVDHRGPEARVDDRRLGQDDRRAGRQVGVQDRQPVAVVQRQRGDAAVGRSEGEELGDGGGVGDEVAVREPHELRGAGRPRRAEQQAQVGVEVPGIGGVALDLDAGGRRGDDGRRPPRRRDAVEVGCRRAAGRAPLPAGRGR